MNESIRYIDQYIQFEFIKKCTILNEYVMQLNNKKIKVMMTDNNTHQQVNIRNKVIDGKKLKRVNSFKHLESRITADRRSNEGIKMKNRLQQEEKIDILRNISLNEEDFRPNLCVECDTEHIGHLDLFSQTVRKKIIEAFDMILEMVVMNHTGGKES